MKEELADFSLHYTDERLCSPSVSTSHAHTYTVSWSPNDSTALCLRHLQTETSRRTPLISDMQAGVPFKAEGTGADETKTDTAAGGDATRVSPEPAKVTQPVPVYSSSPPPRQPHGSTLALSIHLEREVRESFGDECTVSPVGQINSAMRDICFLRKQHPVRTQRWAEVTAANCHSRFALIVFICLSPYRASLTAGVTVEHLWPGSGHGQSPLPLPGPWGASVSVCSGDAWISSAVRNSWKITKLHPLWSMTWEDGPFPCIFLSSSYTWGYLGKRRDKWERDEQCLQTSFFSEQSAYNVSTNTQKMNIYSV